MKRLNVALLYNLKQNAQHFEGEPWDRWNELDSEKTVAGIERALRAGGHEVIGMEGNVTLPQKLDFTSSYLPPANEVICPERWTKDSCR